jgi:hypothetical protein
MKKILVFIGNKMAFLGAVMLAAIAGGLTTAVVLAAIPDGSGAINACYKNSTQVLRVTDPLGNCTTNETALIWKQNGGPSAFGHIMPDDTMDIANSKNITNLNVDNGGNGILCFTVAGSPKNVQVSPDSRGGEVPGIYIKGISPAPPEDYGFQNCAPENNVEVFWGYVLPNPNGLFITFFE